MVRARYGTGVFLKLNKRNCDMRIRLTPYDYDLLRVHWRIDGENYYFLASCVVGSQFSAFLRAIYCLYEEKGQPHYLHSKYDKNITHEYPSHREDKRHQFSAKIFWCGEGPFYDITFVRNTATEGPVLNPNTPDPIQIKIRSSRQPDKECTVDGRDLCYAVARGCTEALKKYGFTGYTLSTGGSYLGDGFNIEELLFVKAYALNALEVCKAKIEWRNPNPDYLGEAKSTDFADELELLLFDM